MKDLAKIIRYSAALKGLYLGIMALVIITSLLAQATPFLLKFIVDAIVAKSGGQAVAASYILILLGLILLANLAITFISNYSGYLGDLMSVRLNSLLSKRYYEHILKLPVSYFDNEIIGRVTNRLERSIATITGLMQSLSNMFIGFFLTSIITLVIIVFYSWPIALLLGALFPLYIWITTMSSKGWQQKQMAINEALDTANGRFVESVGQVRVVKSFARELSEFQFYSGKRKEIEDRTKDQSVFWHKYDIYRRVSLNIIFGFIYLFIVIETFNGNFSLGDMTLLIQLTTQAQFPLFASSYIIDQIQRAAAGSRDFFEVMETTPAIEDKPGSKALKVTRAKVEYKDVDFSYHEGKEVLKNVSFTVEPGKKLALVGESGEGKTTISNLLLRFYEPSNGQILIDGQDITKVTQPSLRQNVAVVFQEPALFSGTLAENIAYGKPNATEAEITAAAKAANAHDFITKFEHGYRSQIGERGVKLSGGQKQRIAIARAILKNAPILILDEATSSLDSKAEREVQNALEALMKNRTTLIIAHRLSTIQNVDFIVGIRGGEVAEIGSPQELAHKPGGIYAELLSLQTPTKANLAKLRRYEIAKS